MISLVQIPELLKKGPVILIPSHRSYIDFLITSYILFAFGIPVPFIASGEDFLNMSFVSNLLRFGGAFFLRRSFRGDVLYNAIFAEVRATLWSSFQSTNILFMIVRTKVNIIRLDNGIFH